MIGPGTSPNLSAPNRRRSATSALLLACPGVILLHSLVTAREFWISDVIANLAPQLAAAMLPLLALALARRRPLPALVLAAAILTTAWMLVGARAPRETGPPAPGVLRILHCNVLSSNPRIDDAEAFVLGGDHDIVTLMELPRDIGRALRAGGASERYPHLLTSGPIKGYSGWVTILSRWPLEPWSDGSLTPGNPRPDDATGTMCAVARTPLGPVGIVAVHASSPWAPARWRIGNIVARRAASIASEMRARGLPVVIIGDLNATPTGARSRALARDASLSRSKPWHTPSGTYPAWLPWPLRVAIDDALVSDAFRVRSWRTLKCPGSDHSALEIELVVSAPPG